MQNLNYQLNNYDSEEDSDEEFENRDNYNKHEYSSEEVSKTRFNLVLCELYNERIHGNCGDSLVKYHYLLTSRFKYLDINYINEIIDFTFNSYAYLSNQYHIIFRNYKNIIRNSNYIIPEIAECIKLENEEFIAIKKTFWIRIIQRKWKKIFKIKQEIFRKRILSSSLRYREIHGKWPIECRYNQTLKGMFYN